MFLAWLTLKNHFVGSPKFTIPKSIDLEIFQKFSVRNPNTSMLTSPNSPPTPLTTKKLYSAGLSSAMKSKSNSVKKKTQMFRFFIACDQILAMINLCLKCSQISFLPVKQYEQTIPL